MPLNLNRFKISSYPPGGERANVLKKGYFFLLRIIQETEVLFKKLRFSGVFLKALYKGPMIKEAFLIYLASFVFDQLSSLKNFSFKKIRFLNKNFRGIYGPIKETPFLIFLVVLKGLVKEILFRLLDAQYNSQKKKLPNKFKKLKKKRGSKWPSLTEKKLGLFSLLKTINDQKKIPIFPLFLFRGKKQILGFFIAFFPFFISSNERYQNFKSEKNFNQKKKIRLSNKEKNFEKISYEEIGLFPRSFSRVFDRFVKQLFNDVENLVLQEYRFYRYLFLTTVKCFFILLLVPFLVNLLAKNYLVRPLTEYLWNTKQSEIFLNAYQQKHAFSELKYFEEKLYFESLVVPSAKTIKQTFPRSLPLLPSLAKQGKEEPVFASSDSVVLSSPKGKSKNPYFFGEPCFFEEPKGVLLATHRDTEGLLSSLAKQNSSKESKGSSFLSFPQRGTRTFTQLRSCLHPLWGKKGLENKTSHFSQNATTTQKEKIFKKVLCNSVDFEYKLGGNFDKKKKPNQEEKVILKKTRIGALQSKTVELTINYNNQSIEAITNFFADLLSVITFFFLLVAMEIPINISKSFLLEVFFGLDDSKKSLLILLVTDLLVGYHSDGPWAIFFESLFNHYGLPESQTGIFLLVATLPVLLDVLFKYLIFRHLNRASPATVATYHAMIE